MKKFPAIFCALTLFVSVCGEDAEEQSMEDFPTRVKAIKVLTTNAPITLSYSGQVVDRDQMIV